MMYMRFLFLRCGVSDIDLPAEAFDLSAVPSRKELALIDAAATDLLPHDPTPSLDEIAAQYRHELPRALRLFLRGPGATKASGAGVLSYLLFEPGYCNALIELGYRDAMEKRAEIARFLGMEEWSL